MTIRDEFVTVERPHGDERRHRYKSVKDMQKSVERNGKR